MIRCEKEARANLCTFVHRAYDQSLITSSSGSFSCRLSAKDAQDLSFIITPTGVDRRSLEAADLCVVSSNPKASDTAKQPQAEMPKLDNPSKLWFHPLHAAETKEEVSPSRAAPVHGSIYQMHPDVNYIMVVQPPFATSYCITGRPFDSAGIPESHIVLHNVQTVPIEAVLQDNGIALAKALDPKSGKNKVLVEGYGLVTVGNDLLKTFVQVEVCEFMCGEYC